MDAGGCPIARGCHGHNRTPYPTPMETRGLLWRVSHRHVACACMLLRCSSTCTTPQGESASPCITRIDHARAARKRACMPPKGEVCMRARLQPLPRTEGAPKDVRPRCGVRARLASLLDGRAEKVGLPWCLARPRCVFFCVRGPDADGKTSAMAVLLTRARGHVRNRRELLAWDMRGEFRSFTTLMRTCPQNSWIYAQP